MKTIKVKDYYGNYLSIPVDDQFYDEWKDLEREENRLYKRERYHCFPVDPDTFDDLAVSTGADDLIEDLIRTEENHRLYAAISKLTPIQRRRVLMFMDNMSYTDIARVEKRDLKVVMRSLAKSFDHIILHFVIPRSWKMWLALRFSPSAIRKNLLAARFELCPMSTQARAARLVQR